MLPWERSDLQHLRRATYGWNVAHGERGWAAPQICQFPRNVGSGEASAGQRQVAHLKTPSRAAIASITAGGTSLSTSTSVYARSLRDLFVIVAMLSPAIAISCEMPPTMLGTLALAMRDPPAGLAGQRRHSGS